MNGRRLSTEIPGLLDNISIQRPRNLDWQRAAALLYGDWGTSKAYVLGLAFAATGFSSLPVIIAVCALTLLVGLNYIVICRCFQDGGGVYSSAGVHGKVLSVVAALLLVADLTVTAALSGWAALSYLGVPNAQALPEYATLSRELAAFKSGAAETFHARQHDTPAE